MKVHQLIEKLKQLDPEALVIHRGYESGYDIANDAGPIETTVYPMKKHVWYEGEYETIPEWTEYEHAKYDADKPTKAVII